MKSVITCLIMSGIVFGLGACQTSARYGKVQTAVKEYLVEPGHKAFFLHETDHGGFVYAYAHSRDSAKEAYDSAKRIVMSCSRVSISRAPALLT